MLRYFQNLYLNQRLKQNLKFVNDAKFQSNKILF